MPRAYPYIHPERGFLHDDEPLPAKELMRGHATVPGPRDPYSIPEGIADFADGTPGIPRIWPTPMSQGPGTPGPTPGGPSRGAPTHYDGPTDMKNG